MTQRLGEDHTFWSWFPTMKETRLRKYTSRDERVNDSTWIKDSRENFDCEHRPFSDYHLGPIRQIVMVHRFLSRSFDN